MNRETTTRERMQVKPYSQKEICHLYQVSDKTLKKWLRPFTHEIGERNGRIYTVLQVEIIFKRLGVPYWVEVG